MKTHILLRGGQCRNVNNMAHVLIPTGSGTASVSLQMEVSCIMFKAEMEKRSKMRDMKNDMAVYFSRNSYFCLSRTAQNLCLLFLSKAEQVLLVFSLLIVSRFSELWFIDLLV